MEFDAGEGKFIAGYIKDDKLYQVLLTNEQSELLKLFLHGLTEKSIKILDTPICEVKVEKPKGEEL
jgi:hypothetical protein